MGSECQEPHDGVTIVALFYSRAQRIALEAFRYLQNFKEITSTDELSGIVQTNSCKVEEF